MVITQSAGGLGYPCPNFRLSWGYYAHIAAIDDNMGKIWKTIQEACIEENTIIVFTADHGDLLSSHGAWNKQQPYEESIRVPFLIHYTAVMGKSTKTSDVLLNTPDIMPTLLSMCGLPIPASVEGMDLSKFLKGESKSTVEETLVSCVQPFGQWSRDKGGKEYRGIVTQRYTYTRDLNGPWLLFDNEKDPFQLNNLVGKAERFRPIWISGSPRYSALETINSGPAWNTSNNGTTSSTKPRRYPTSK